MSGGRPISPRLRHEAEPLVGPLPDVRIHDDSLGGRVALSLGAKAVTIANHVYLTPGQMGLPGAHKTLLHELHHVAAQDPALGVTDTLTTSRTDKAEAMARRVERGEKVMGERLPVGIYRSPMPWADFQQEMRRRFGVTRIFEGTFDQQRDRLNHFNRLTRPGDRLTRAMWSRWYPGADSTAYDWVISAFVSLARSFGGIPAVSEIGFYKTDYALRGSRLIRNPDIVADYGGGLMAIYQTALTYAPALPTGRSTGTTPSPRVTPSPEQAFTTTVTHELGHGLVETGLTPRSGVAPDRALADDYQRTVGWTSGSSPQLFDAGVPAVRTALAAGTTPPAAYRITRFNWNNPRWVEQPLSAYMTTRPSEDMPEAVAYYVHNRSLLQSRSPRRYEFINTRFTALRRYLRPDPGPVRLFPTDAEMMRWMERSATPPWHRPVTPVEPGEPEERVPLFQIRF